MESRIKLLSNFSNETTASRKLADANQRNDAKRRETSKVTKAKTSMSNNVTVETEIDRDLSNVDISRPLFDNVFVKCHTGEVKVEVNDKGLKSLVVPLVFDEPAVDTKGITVHPGFVVTDRILITPTGGLDQKMIDEKLSRFQVAVLRLDKPQNFGKTEQYVNKPVRVQFKLRADKNDTTKFYQDVKSYNKT